MIHSTFPISNPPITNHNHFHHNLKTKTLFSYKFNYHNNKTKNISLHLTITRNSMSSNRHPSIMLTSGASGRINALLSLHALRGLFRLISAFLLIFTVPFRGKMTDCNEESSKGKVVKRVPVAMVVRRSVGNVDKEVAARRAIAIRRVVEDDCGEDTVREYEVVTMGRGETMFTQSWTPVKGHIRGLVIILHGLNEHSGRYNDFAKKLNANGFKVYGMDWIGHGGSDGLHAYVHSLDAAVNDMKVFLDKVLSENPSVPCFCFGHSTGGAIVLKAALDPKVSRRIDGVVLTSPAVGVHPSHPILALLAPVLSFLLPRFQFSAANKRGIAVSRDPEALLAKYSDPLVFTGSIRARTGHEILRITSNLQENLSKLTVPFLVLHGTADTVTDPKASRKLHDEASSTDKTMRLYEGLLHDLLFEPEKEEVMDSIISWLTSRLRGPV